MALDHDSPRRFEPADAPSAWDYARTTHAVYFTLAGWALFLAIWVGASLIEGIDGFWISLLAALLLFITGLVSFVLFVPIVVLGLALAWLTSRAMRVDERRMRIDAYRERERRELQQFIEQPPTPRRVTGEGFVVGLVLGALLGIGWGEDGDP